MNNRRELLEEYIKKCWEDGFIVDIKINLKWKPYIGIAMAPNQKPLPPLKIDTEFGRAEEKIKIL